MPNTSPALDTPELVRYIYDSASRTAVCRVFPVAAASKGRRGEELAELLLMAKAGAVAFSDDGDCIASSGLMSLVLKTVRQTGLAFMQHCQDPALTRGSAMHAGEIAVRLGLLGWPRVAEELIVERTSASTGASEPATTCSTFRAPSRWRSCGARGPRGSRSAPKRRPTTCS